MGFIRDWWILVWWGEAVQDRRGSYGCGGIRFDMAVRVRCCRYGIGAYWLGTAVQVRTGKVFTGLVSSGWAGSVQRKG